MIAWMLVMGVRASLLTHTLQRESATWEEVQQHVEVIPFFLSSEAVSHDRVPLREEQLSVAFGPISLRYHYIFPKSLPQADYLQAKNSLKSLPQIEVLQRFCESLQWQQSAYFVFLIYDDTVQAVDTSGVIKPENFTFYLDLKEFELRDEILVVRLAYTQVIGLSNLHRLLMPM